MKRLIMVVTLVIVSFSAFADGDKKIKILSTLATPASIAREIGGDKVDVDTPLASPRQNPHEIVPKPTYFKRANDCNLFIEFGKSLDIWANDVASGSGNTHIQRANPGRVVATDGVPALELPAVLSREWGDLHPSGNPHCQLDPLAVKVIAENITVGLKNVDPDNSDYYDKRLEDFKGRIDKALYGEALIKEVGAAKLNRLAENYKLLDYIKLEKLEDKVSGWLKKAEPLRGLKIITYHKSWIYFTDRFGLDVAAEIEEKPGIQPTARWRDKLVDKVKREHIKIIEVDSFYPTDEANYIAEKAGAKVIVLPLDVGGADGTDDYFHFMDYVIEKFVQAAK